MPIHVMDNYTLRTPNRASSMPMPMAANVDRRTRGGRAVRNGTGARSAAVVGMDLQDSRHRSRSASGIGAYKTRRA
jgi:iron complex outermembrane receptor protein